MIYITQLIYIRPGKEAEFDAFEDVAIPLIGKYNGELMLRLRPSPENFIGPVSDPPYEVHLVRFNEEADFERFKADKEREKFLHLKNEAVRDILMIKSTP
jgi:hypothetical protein